MASSSFGSSTPHTDVGVDHVGNQGLAGVAGEGHVGVKGSVARSDTKCSTDAWSHVAFNGCGVASNDDPEAKALVVSNLFCALATSLLVNHQDAVAGL